jgi:ribose transport system substrate-binding protein
MQGSRTIRRSAPARRVACLVAAVLASGLVAACGSGGDGVGDAATSSGPKKVRIAMFLVATANTHQQAGRKGAEAAIRTDGNASLRVFGAEFDPKKQASQIEAATASRQYDAFIVNSVDGTATVPAITKATGRGIKVICGFSVCGPDQDAFSKQLAGVSAQVSTDYGAVGRAQAKALADACKSVDPCNTVYIDGAPTLAAEMTITKAFDEAIKSSPNVKVIAHGEGQYLATPAYKSMKDVLQAHPDINAVVSPGDQMIDGARRALDESGLKNKDVALIGDGAGKIAAEGIGAGKWYASAILRPFHEGELEAKAAIAAVRGSKVDQLVNSSVTPGIPELYLSKASLSKFKPEWDG